MADVAGVQMAYIFLIENDTVQAGESGGNASLVDIFALGPHEPTALFVVQDVASSLVPEDRAVDTQFSDDISAEDLSVGSQCYVLGLGRWLDQLHQDPSLPFRLREGSQEVRDRLFVDVVPTALTLGFQHVVGCCFGSQGEAAPTATRGKVILRSKGRS